MNLLVDPFLAQLCKGYTEAEVAELEQYIAEWDASTYIEVTRNYINNLLKQLTVDYQNTKQERKKIASLSPAGEEEFTVLEEIDLLADS